MQGNVTHLNGANASQTLAIQPGSSADYAGVVQFNNYSGAAKWQIQKDTNNYLRVTDAANSLDRMILPANANTTINAGAGANAVVINNTSGSGTGGLIVYEGGSNYSTAALQVSGSGNTTATGYLQGKFIMGTGTMGVAAGAAAGSSPTIACATSHTCDGVSGTVTLTTGTSPTTGTLATLSFPNTHTNQANCMVTTLSATANDHQRHMDGEHDGNHDHGECGADGVNGVHDQVLVRGVLKKGAEIAGLAEQGNSRDRHEGARGSKRGKGQGIKSARMRRFRERRIKRTTLEVRPGGGLRLRLARDLGSRAPSLRWSARDCRESAAGGDE